MESWPADWWLRASVRKEICLFCLHPLSLFDCYFFHYYHHCAQMLSIHSFGVVNYIVIHLLSQSILPYHGGSDWSFPSNLRSVSEQTAHVSLATVILMWHSHKDKETLSHACSWPIHHDQSLRRNQCGLMRCGGLVVWIESQDNTL